MQPVHAERSILGHAHLLEEREPEAASLQQRVQVSAQRRVSLVKYVMLGFGC